MDLSMPSATIAYIASTVLPDVIVATSLALATISPGSIPSPPNNPFNHNNDVPPGMTANSHGPHDHPPRNECELLGPFALLVQLALGGLALTTLVFKRWRERPQRPFKVWLFDVSKQVVGSVLVHIANLLMSMLSAGELSMSVADVVNSAASADSGIVGRSLGLLMRRDHDENGNYTPNPCSFYLLNLAIDTTIGIPILIVLLRIFTGLFSMTSLGNPPDSLRSGHYGSPPKPTWWFKQCIIYFLGLLGMKVCVLVIFLVLPWISQIGDWALRWTEGNEKLQVFFVMMFFPLIMNATQYYIIDTFIKNQKPDDVESDEERARLNEEDQGFDGVNNDDFGSVDEDADEDLVAKSNKQPINVKTKAVKHGKSSDRHTYDEDYDGESSPTVVGSGSETHKRKGNMDD